MRGTGPLKRKSSIIQREVGKERVEGRELLADRRLEYSVFRGLEGETVSADRPQVRNDQSTKAPPLPHVDVSLASGLWSRGRIPGAAAVPRKPVVLCSQVSSLCRASLWSNSFTLAATQYGHNQSCHQPAVQTQAKELHSYNKPRGSIQCSMHNSISV